MSFNKTTLLLLAVTLALTYSTHTVKIAGSIEVAVHGPKDRLLLSTNTAGQERTCKLKDIEFVV